VSGDSFLIYMFFRSSLTYLQEVPEMVSFYVMAGVVCCGGWFFMLLFGADPGGTTIGTVGTFCLYSFVMRWMESRANDPQLQAAAIAEVEVEEKVDRKTSRIIEQLHELLEVQDLGAIVPAVRRSIKDLADYRTNDPGPALRTRIEELNAELKTLRLQLEQKESRIKNLEKPRKDPERDAMTARLQGVDAELAKAAEDVRLADRAKTWALGELEKAKKAKLQDDELVAGLNAKVAELEALKLRLTTEIEQLKAKITSDAEAAVQLATKNANALAEVTSQLTARQSELVDAQAKLAQAIESLSKAETLRLGVQRVAETDAAKWVKLVSEAETRVSQLEGKHAAAISQFEQTQAVALAQVRRDGAELLRTRLQELETRQQRAFEVLREEHRVAIAELSSKHSVALAEAKAELDTLQSQMAEAEAKHKELETQATRSAERLGIAWGVLNENMALIESLSDAIPMDALNSLVDAVDPEKE
jgi:chromosome segregation ATPase